MKKFAVLAPVTLALLTVSAHAQIQNRTIRVSNGVNETHPVATGVKAMAECAANRSDGKLKIQGFWSAALGDDVAATNALRAGTLEMVIPSSSALVGMQPALGVYDLPFLFNNEKEADAVLDGAFGRSMSNKMTSLGLVNLAYWENGFRSVTNSKRPINKMEDLAGLKIRVIPNPIYLETFKTLKTNPVPMPFSEVLPAMETGAIDGQENPPVTIETSKMYEVQDYLSFTRHIYTPFMVLYSKKLWDRLSKEEQKIISECAIVGRDAQRKASRTRTDEAVAALKTHGMKVNEIAPAEIAKMRAAVKPVYEQQAKTIGQANIDQIQKVLAGLRK